MWIHWLQWKQCCVLCSVKVGKPAPDNIERALEANVYAGVDSYIIMSREYFIDWTCDYDLLYYPFDTQVKQLLRSLKVHM